MSRSNAALLMGTICIVGIGNTLRSDDGVAAYVCEQLQQMNFHNVDIMVVQQLQTELIDTLTNYQRIMIVDASALAGDVHLQEINAIEGTASSHHMSAPALKAIAERLYGVELSITLCSVPVQNFGFGEELSATAMTNAATAIYLISDWIKAVS